MATTTEERPARDKNGNLVPLGHNHQLVVATYQTWTIKVPAQYAFGDLSNPSLWQQVELVLQARTGRPAPGDLLRAIADDGSFDAFFVIKAVKRGYELVYSRGRRPEQDAT